MSVNRKSFMIDDLLSSSHNNHHHGHYNNHHNTWLDSMATHGSFMGGKNLSKENFFAACDHLPSPNSMASSVSLIQLLSLVGHPSLMLPVKTTKTSTICPSDKVSTASIDSNESTSSTATTVAATSQKNLLAIQSEIVRRKMLLVAKPRKGGQIRFTGKQIEILESLFHQSKYITSDERKRISNQVKLSEKQIKTWFQNRRAKCKKPTSNSSHGQRSCISLCEGLALSRDNELSEYKGKKSMFNLYSHTEKLHSTGESKLMTSNINILFDNNCHTVNDDTLSSSSSASTVPLSPSTWTDEL